MRTALKYIVILQPVVFCGVTGVNIKEIWEWNLVNIHCGNIVMQKSISK